MKIARVRRTLAACLALVLLAASAAVAAVPPYAYAGGPMQLRLADGTTVAVAMHGRVWTGHHRMDLLLDGVLWRSFELADRLALRQRHRAYMEFDGHRLIANCERLVDYGQRNRANPVAAACELRLDGKPAGSLRPDRVMLPNARR